MLKNTLSRRIPFKSGTPPDTNFLRGQTQYINTKKLNKITNRRGFKVRAGIQKNLIDVNHVSMQGKGLIAKYIIIPHDPYGPRDSSS